MLERYEEDAETLRSKRREILAEAKEEARKILDGSNAAIERTIREIRESQAEKERTAEARRQMAQEKEALLNADTRASKNKLLQKAPKAKKGNADKNVQKHYRAVSAARRRRQRETRRARDSR